MSAFHSWQSPSPFTTAQTADTQWAGKAILLRQASEEDTCLGMAVSGSCGGARGSEPSVTTSSCGDFSGLPPLYHEKQGSAQIL